MFENYILTYQTANGASVASDIYTFDILLESLAYAASIGYAGKKFYTGDRKVTDPSDFDTAKFKQSQIVSQDLQLRYGLVNAATFLSQVVVESVQYNVCEDYYPSDTYGSEYPSNYGQFGAPYTEYKCSPDESQMECPETAAEVKGIGGLMTKGRCMLGKLNKYLGPSYGIDFCNNPSDVCQDKRFSNPSIVWDVPLFEWVDRIQSYNDHGFNYLDELHKFVDGGMVSDDFIVGVSKILTKGSVDAQGQVPRYGDRMGNFYLLLKYLVKERDGESPSIPTANNANLQVYYNLLLLLPLVGMLLLW